MYEELVKRLNAYSAEHEYHGGITAEAADVIQELRMRLHGDEAAISGMKREIERMVINATRWIPVTERLPQDNTRVIGFMAWKAILTIEYEHKMWFCIDHLEPLPDEAVTHWMPLPEPPKEEA